MKSSLARGNSDGRLILLPHRPLEIAKVFFFIGTEVLLNTQFEKQNAILANVHSITSVKGLHESLHLITIA